jgi:predicted CXXCH cytochrome family protein
MPFRYLAALWCVALCGAADDGPEIFSPPANAAFPSGEVRLVARASGEMKPLLDGKPVSVESPHPGVLKALLKLANGPHELTLGERTTRFFVGPNAPAEFKPFRDHPPMQATCETCHMVRNGAWRFQRISLTGVCSQCHSKETFAAKHTHEMGIVPDCQMCHAPHGSTAAASLKLPKEKACRLCHPLN